MTNEKLTERITIRLTPGELKILKRLAWDEGNEYKASSFARRILIAYFKKRDRNYGTWDAKE